MLEKSDHQGFNVCKLQFLTGGRGGRGGASRGHVSEFCVRLRGLPWESTKVCTIITTIIITTTIFQEDIADFLHKCRIIGGLRGITIMEDDRGRFDTFTKRVLNHDIFLRAAGDAYVELETADDLDDALRMHKRDMGTR